MLKNYFAANYIEAGCDEAGRGCLSGPVVAASVILPSNYINEELDDSKKLLESKRLKLCEIIKKDAIAWAVGIVDNKTIDKINILKSSIKAMHIAIGKLKPIPEYLIIDGNYFLKYKSIPHKCIIKGDSKYMSIAAASIIAKTHRDELMYKIHKEYPVYNWIQNKGYPTKQHRKAIVDYGISKYHRKSFKLIDYQLKFNF